MKYSINKCFTIYSHHSLKLERTLANNSYHRDSTNSNVGEMFDTSGIAYYCGKIHLEEISGSGLKISK